MPQVSPQRFHDLEETSMWKVPVENGSKVHNLGRGKNPEFFRKPEMMIFDSKRFEFQIDVFDMKIELSQTR